MLDGAERRVSRVPSNLSQVKTLPQLIKYLRDELDWPIGSEDFEDLTFEYTPEELGIDSKNAAKIQDIKRLRPLSVNQPWGVFFVKFEPKRLPVVALRRILSAFVLKKRASANRADQASWAADDLLFISNYGEGDARQITFAHFSQGLESEDLPTLNVLGWDNLDTLLHMQDVADTLRQHLVWPEDEEDVDGWRQRWQSAFTLRHREVVTTSRDLAIRLAALARAIRDRIGTALAIETKTGPLTSLLKSFQAALVHDLDAIGFADMYAQTIAYGLLSARVANPKGRTPDDGALHVPVTNPFLKELMETFLHVGGGREQTGGPGGDFDELGVTEVVELLDDANMEKVILDFGDKNPREDPVVHFYELFLKEYDAKQRMQRGVFYTPRPVVTYIVRSVDEQLRAEFGLEDGLADTSTWSEIASRNSGVKIPNGVDPEQSFVQILDPAVGTGTFLVEVIDVIHRRMMGKWKAQGSGGKDVVALWNDYVSKHLLPRLHGYEFLMAPYAIAHLKIGLKLHETGYRFGTGERTRIYLTNSLEPPQDSSGQLEFSMPALAHEARAVSEIKQKQRFTVVLGNPPYSQMSQNLGDLERELVAPYRSVDGVRIVERGAITFERNLQDDYVKFVRLAEVMLEASGIGVVGLITNHAFLSIITLRGMRFHLLSTFDSIRVLDLHGSLKLHEVPPAGVSDENVFDIQQGVSIALLTRRDGEDKASVAYSEIWGTRAQKYDALLSGDLLTTGIAVEANPPQYLFVPRNEEVATEYEQYLPLTKMFDLYGSGITTARDGIVVGFDSDTICARVQKFQDATLSDQDILSTMGLRESAIWSIRRARDQLNGVVPEQFIVDVGYRPFDVRKLFYHDSLVSSPRHPTMRHMGRSESLALAVCRQQGVPGFRHVFVSRLRFDEGLVSNRSREKTACFPLYLSQDEMGSLLKEPGVNIRLSLIDHLVQSNHSARGNAKGLDDQPPTVTSKDQFCYAYAIFHSPGYRSRYAELLKADFPRVPLPGNLDLFATLGRLGDELVDLHLMESPVLDHSICTFIGKGSPEIGRIGWSDDTVWLDATAKGPTKGTMGFRGVPKEVWTFQIGGYQVCEKWLKDRKGRKLSRDDIDHYQRIVVALAETTRLMKEIDDVIEEHGGWPRAFAGDGRVLA